MSTRAPVLLLRSANRNFPLDLEPELAAAGYEVTCVSSLSEYIASPTRARPQLVVVEIGLVDELDRAVLLVDWTEHVQPLAPARYLLLIASKNLAVGDRAVRLGPAEIVVLPQPARNLLFKLELQSRLLTAPAKKPESAASGFVAKFEEVHGPSRKRVLAVRGRDPRQGAWRDSGNTPSGKVRWRWVSAPGEKAAETSFAWTAVSQTAPRFDEKAGAWLLEGEGDDLVCENNGEKLFSALESDPEAKEETKESSGRSEPFVLPVDVSAKPGEEPAVGARPRPHAGKDTPEKTFRKDAPGPEAPAVRQEAAPRAAPEKISIKAEPAAEKPAAEKRFGKEPREKAPAPADADDESESPPPAAVGPVPKAVRSAAERARAALAQAEASLGEAKPETGGGTGTPAPAPWHHREAEGRDPVKREVNVHAGSGASAPITEKNRIESAPKAAPSGMEPAAGERSAATGPVPSERPAPAAREPAPKSAEARISAEPASRTEDVPSRARAEREPLPSLGEPVPDITADVPDRGQAPPPGEKPARAPAPERPARETEPATASRSEPAPSLPGQPALQVRPEAAPAAKAPEPAFHSEAVPVQSAATRPSPDPAIGAAPSTATAKGPLELGQREEPETRVSPATVTEEKHTVKAQAPAEAEEIRIAATKADAEEEDSRRFLKQRHFELMTLGQLGDRESSWHPVGRYRIYLSAQHRYYGLKHPQNALPLWVYEGELAPEFIDEQGAWKFYDRLPISVPRLESLPSEVVEHLYKICGLPVPTDAAPKAPGPAVVIMNGAAKPASTPAGGPNTAAPDHDPYMPESNVAKKKTVWGKITQTVKKVLGKN